MSCPARRDALCSSAAGMCKLGYRLKQCNPLFGSFSGARLRANGNPPICPAALADGGGKELTFEGEARVFRVPPSARSEGSPQGQDWLGAFSCFFFWARKEKREYGDSCLFQPLLHEPSRLGLATAWASRVENSARKSPWLPAVADGRCRPGNRSVQNPNLSDAQPVRPRLPWSCPAPG